MSSAAFTFGTLYAFREARWHHNCKFNPAAVGKTQKI